MTKVAGLLLAAGASTRMGRPKQLLPLGQQTLLDQALTEALNSDLDLVVLVLGHEAERIRKSLKGARHPKLRIIENKDYGRGISTSISAGLAEVEGDFDHVMIILADMPRVTSNVIDRLRRRYLESRLPLAAMKTGSRHSPPVMINREYYPQLHQLRGDIGARDLFTRCPDQVCLVEPEEEHGDMDIDTPEDYREFRESPVKDA